MALVEVVETDYFEPASHTGKGLQEIKELGENLIRRRLFELDGLDSVRIKKYVSIGTNFFYENVAQVFLDIANSEILKSEYDSDNLAELSDQIIGLLEGETWDDESPIDLAYLPLAIRACNITTLVSVTAFGSTDFQLGVDKLLDLFTENTGYYIISSDSHFVDFSVESLPSFEISRRIRRISTVRESPPPRPEEYYIHIYETIFHSNLQKDSIEEIECF